MRKEAEKKWIVGPFEYIKRNRSWWWLALPLLLGLIGALISFFAIRKDDPRKGRICLYVGIVMLALHLGLGYFG